MDCQGYLAGWGMKYIITVQLQEHFLISKKRLMFRNPATHMYYTVYLVKTSSAEVCDVAWSVCTFCTFTVFRYKSLLIKQPHREVSRVRWQFSHANRGRGLTLSFPLKVNYDLKDFNVLYLKFYSGHLCWILHNQSCISWETYPFFIKALGQELP